MSHPSSNNGACPPRKPIFLPTGCYRPARDVRVFRSSQNSKPAPLKSKGCGTLHITSWWISSDIIRSWVAVQTIKDLKASATRPTRMFGTPIEKTSFADVDSFCRSGVREGVLLDFKRDFPARLEKAISAFANTYGGLILIGVDEMPTGEPMTPICGIPLATGLRERVIQIGLDAVNPPVIPDVKVVGFKSNDGLAANDRAVVVIRVPESDIGGHAVDHRTTVYLRVESISDPYRKATVDELEWFRNKREKAIAEKQRMLSLVQQHAQQYLIRLRTRRQMATSEPAARCVCWTVPRFPRQPIAAPHELLRIGYDLRWPLDHHRHLFPLGSINAVTEGIFFDGDYYSAYRYTELQQQGLAYHEYGFWWDDDSKIRDLVSPPNIAELLISFLRYGVRLYERTGYWGLVDFEFRLAGVRGRKFREPTGFVEPWPEFGAVDDIISVREVASVSEFLANGVGLAKGLMTDLAWAFGIQGCPSSVEKYLASVSI